MARVKAMIKPGDYAAAGVEAPPEDIKALFDYMYPGVDDPEIDDGHLAFAVAARNPKLALNLVRLVRTTVLDTAWCKRRDLMELSIQTLSLRFDCDLMFKARIPNVAKMGLSADLVAAIPYWRKSDLFDDEQKLVIEYTQALTDGDVPEALFARAVAQWGETGAVEFTTVAGVFSFLAMFMNATRP